MLEGNEFVTIEILPEDKCEECRCKHCADGMQRDFWIRKTECPFDKGPCSICGEDDFDEISGGLIYRDYGYVGECKYFVEFKESEEC